MSAGWTFFPSCPAADSRHVGLGAHVEVKQAAEPGDMYGSYRRARSDTYHDMVLKSVMTGNVTSNMGRGGK